MPQPKIMSWAHRVVVCGEAGSGKSTVINTLLRETKLTYGLVSEERPIIIFRYAKQAGVLASFKSGEKAIFRSVSQCLDLKGIASLTVFHTKEHMKNVEVSEIPMDRSARISNEAQAIIRNADTLVWTTNASQAWRLSERDAVQKLLQYCPPRRFAVVSRTDMLKSHSDRKKILKRLQTEARVYFEDFHFIYGNSDLIDSSQYEEEGWQSTGGSALLSALIDGVFPDLSVKNDGAKSVVVEKVAELGAVELEYRLETLPAISAAGLLNPKSSSSREVFFGEKEICSAVTMFAKDVQKTLSHHTFFRDQLSYKAQIQIGLCEHFVFVDRTGKGDAVFFAVFDKKMCNLGMARKQFFDICEVLE